MHNLVMRVRISKYLFSNLTRVFTTNIVTVEQHVPKYTVCSSETSTVDTFIPMFCDGLKTSENSADNFDAQFQTETEVEKYTYYTFEKNTEAGYFEIISDGYVKRSLSKSAIKQFLLYCFIPANDNYVRKGVSFKQIADLCNISIPAVKTNHAVLQELGFIYSTPAGRGKVDIAIVDEYKLFESKKNGGTGYLTMSIDMLETILGFNSINELRIELEKIRRADRKKSRKSTLVYFNKGELTKVLPDYIKKSPKLVDEVLNNENSLFPVVGDNLDISNYENQKTLTNRLKEQIKGKIELLFELTGNSYCLEYTRLTNRANSLESKGYHSIAKDIRQTLSGIKAYVIDDLCKLGLEFGVNNIINAIQHMFKTKCFADPRNGCNINLIKTPGAFIRTIIDTHISLNGSLNTISI